MKKALYIIIACILSLGLLLAGIFTWRTYEDTRRLSLTMNGEREIYLEYGQLYDEPGVHAELLSEEDIIDVPVTTQGEVSPQVLGKYLIKYTAQVEDIIRTDYRRVHVVDTQKPVITLVTNPGSYTILGQPYEEEGFTATDNHDGDLTQKVIRTEADGIVTYTVSDSSGNTTTVKRTIAYLDPGNPKILLDGAKTVLLMAGDAYEEPGYYATDDYNEDLTPFVTVENNLDCQTPGKYTLRYTLTSDYGVRVTDERTVYVLPPEAMPKEFQENPLPQGGAPFTPNDKTIYLTFDDGPSKHTAKLLDILAKYDIKVSFFVVQSSRADMIARAYREGHTIAIHTYSHNYSKIYAGDDAFMADLQAIQDVILQQTGHKTMLTRFPGGSSNTISRDYSKGIMTRLTKKLTELGYQYFDWNVDSNDAGGARTADKVFENVTKGVADRTNSVVLQHDTHEYSIDAVERIIVWGLCNGYTFKPLNHDSPTCHHPVNN